MINKEREQLMLGKTVLTLILTLFMATAAAGSVDAYNLEVNPADPQVGEEVTISFDAQATGEDTVSDMAAEWPGSSFSENSKFCGAKKCTSDQEFSWSYTPQSPGEKTITAEAYNYFGTNSNKESETIDVSSSEPPVSLKDVGGYNLDLSRGEDTQLQAEISNSNNDYGQRVKVVWKATGGDYPVQLGNRVQTVDSGATETLAPGNLYWEDLKEKGLEEGREYTLEAQLYYDSDGDGVFDSSEVVGTQEASNNLIIRSAGPSVSLDKVTATKFTISQGQYTQLHAHVQNSNPDYGQEVKVAWQAKGGDYPVNLGSRIQAVDSGTTETLAPENLYWNNLREKGLQPGQNYDLEAKLYFDSNGDGSFESSEVISTKTAGNQLVIKPKDQEDSDPQLEPDFDWTPKGPEEGQRVTFDAGESKGDIVEYDWEFGNGFTGSGKTAHHTYDRDNSYTVKLTVTDAEGNSRSITHTVNVWEDYNDGGNGGDEEEDDQNEGNEDPSADFDWDPHSPEAGESVHFDADESYDGDGHLTDYDWDFGDGSSASGVSPEHTFDSSGSYPVELNVEDNDGAEDSSVKYVHVGGDTTGDQCGITEDSMSFRLEDYSIYEGGSTDAVLDIHNNADSSQDVEVKFKVNQEVIETRDITVSADDSRELRESVSPTEDSFIRAVVSTEGEPCDRKEFSFYKELVVYMDGDAGDEASLDVEVTDEDNDPIEDARVEADGPEDRVRYTDSEGETGFSLEEGSYDVEVSHPDYDTEEQSVHLDEGESEELEFELEEDEEGEGDLQITVKDGDDDWIEDARVEVDGPEDETEYTDDYGFAGFELDEGSYDVEVSHPDYATEAEETVYVDDDETTSRTLRLYEEENEGIEIVDAAHPSSVCRGSTLSVNVDVRNNAEIDEYVAVTGEGLGSINILDEFTVEEGEQETRTIRFTNVQGSGNEDFRIVAKNGTTDSVGRTVDVQNCDIATPDRDARSVSMKLSYSVAPNKAMVGDTVKVSGFVDGVYGKSEVRVNVDGETKARVSTQPDGYYQTFIRVDSPGMKTVTARSAGESASREIEVLPTATVTSVTAPQKVFEGETFEVCSEINSQIQAGTFLYEDGKLLKKVNTNGQKCFEVTAQQPGTHIYKVRAATPGVSSSGTVSVEVLESDVEVKSFPKQVASVESASGMVKVDLYNTQDEEKRYQLELGGLPSDWISQSRKEVLLTQGERKTVYFYITPQEEGTYYPQVTVDADNEEIYRQEIDLKSGGRVRKRPQGFWSRLREAFSL